MKRSMIAIAGLALSFALATTGCSNKTGSGGAGGTGGAGGGGTGGTGGGGGTGGTGGTGGGGAGGSGGSGGGGGTASTDMAVAGGPGTVTGTINVGGTPLMFGDVKTAWMLGKPDANAMGKNDTVVVYLFNKDVTCHDMAVMFGTMGWDMKLPDKTQFLELKEFGPTSGTTPPVAPGTFMAVNPGPQGTPTPGQATCNHSLSHSGAASDETTAGSGTVTIAAITAATSVSGTFTLHFTGSDMLSGNFNAGYCDIGVEP